MIDLHTHILPGIDDGAKDLNESLMLLQAEAADGVDTVVLTPHFRTGMVEITEFLSERQKAFELLRGNVGHVPVKLLLGAEVAFSADLAEMDLQTLCIEGTRVLLLELPSNYYPHLARELFYQLRLKDYTPLIAHVERYPYVMREPEIMLSSFVDSGAYMQINAGSLINDKRTRKKLLKLIERNLLHVVATDTHSVDKRPPELGKALGLVNKKLGADVMGRLVENAGFVVEGQAWRLEG